jgi:hypothetical protein
MWGSPQCQRAEIGSRPVVPQAALVTAEGTVTLHTSPNSCGGGGSPPRKASSRSNGRRGDRSQKVWRNPEEGAAGAKGFGVRSSLRSQTSCSADSNGY